MYTYEGMYICIYYYICISIYNNTCLKNGSYSRIYRKTEVEDLESYNI